MSTSLKQAIEALKERISNAFEKAVEKGSTSKLPKTTIANLEDYIANIPVQKPNVLAVKCDTGNASYGAGFFSSSYLPFDVFHEPIVFDFSQIVNMTNMFNGATGPARDVEINSSACINMQSVFAGSTIVRSFKGTFSGNISSVGSAFQGCTNLVSIDIELPNYSGTMNTFIKGCSNLEYARIIVPKSGNVYELFRSSTKFRSIEFDMSSATTSGTNMITGTYNNLTDVKVVGSINISFTINRAPNLSYESIKSILVACAATKNTSSKTLLLGNRVQDIDGELQSLYDDCIINHSWTINGLTIL